MDAVTRASEKLGGVSPFVVWVAVGVGIRVAVAPFTSHPYDMTVWISHQTRFFNAGLDPVADWKFSAPVMALLLLTFAPALAVSEMFGVPLVLAQQFWIKAPFIAADVGVALLLRRYVSVATGARRDGDVAAILWLLNPTAIFYTAVHGQFDILSAALLLAGFVALQSANSPRALACVVSAGVAKFVGLLVLPLMLIWNARTMAGGWRRAIRAGIIAGALTALAFGSVMLWTGDPSLIRGVGSSVAGTDGASLWSVWAFGPSNGQWRSAAWLVAFIAVYIVAARAVNSHAQQRDIPAFMSVTGGLMCVLISLDPFANPQFVIWSLPLLIGTACATRSAPILIGAIVVGSLNLLAFWMSEDPSVWFLNAVPGIHEMSQETVLPLGLVDRARAEQIGFAYALSLLVLGVWLIGRTWKGARHPRSRRSTWTAAVTATAFIGTLTISGLLGTTYQPALVAKYSKAPRYPGDLERLNTIPATGVRWLAKEDGVVEASWSDGGIRALRADRDRVTVRAVGGNPLLPNIDRQEASHATTVTGHGVHEDFWLEAPFLKVRARLLLGNSNFSGVGEPRAPEISLYAGPEFRMRLRTVVTVEREVARGWFVIRIDQLDAWQGNMYRLDVRAPRKEGWLWNGSQTQAGIPNSDGGTGSTHWLRVWSVADNVDPGTASAGTVSLSDDERYGLIVPADREEALRRGMTIVLPPQLRGDELPSMFLAYDVKREPWWRAASWPVAVVALVCALLILLFWIAVLRLLRWACARPDGPN